jgi:hypothetical protein
MDAMNTHFVQTITFRSDRFDEMVVLMGEWDRNQAAGEIMGYAGLRVLADRDDPGRYISIMEFAAVEPGVSAFEEAQRNNDRPETQALAARLIALSTGEPEFRHFDEVYRTDPLDPGLGHEPTS